MTPVVSVHQVCKAAEQILEDHLAATMDLLGFNTAAYSVIKTLQQVPTVQALSTAQLPALAVASSGTTQPPAYSRAEDAWKTVFDLTIGIYARGRDHEETAGQVRNWCAGIRSTLWQHRSLDGTATGLVWAGEEYALLGEVGHARTIAAAAVTFEVTTLVATTPTPAGGLPVVTSTPTTVSVT